MLFISEKWPPMQNCTALYAFLFPLPRMSTFCIALSLSINSRLHSPDILQ